MLMCEPEDLFVGSTSVSSGASLQGAHFAIKTIDLPVIEMEERSSEYFYFALWGSCATGEHASRTGQYRCFVKPPGSLTFVPPGRIPAARTNSVNRVTWCAIDRGFMISLAEQSGMALNRLHEQAGFADARIRGLVELLMMEAASDGESGSLYTDQLTVALGIRVLSLGPDTSGRKPTSSALTGGPLRNVLERIQISGGRITLETLAKEAGFGQRHFLRMFHQAMGMTPYAYALKVKLTRAQQLMHEEHLSLADVALSSGFSSHSHFTRIFKNYFGVSPSRFRRVL